MRDILRLDAASHAVAIACEGVTDRAVFDAVFDAGETSLRGLRGRA